MRAFLFILCFPAGGGALLLLITAFVKGGSDLQLIGAGVFMTALAVCLGLIGVMARLEQIRDRKS